MYCQIHCLNSSPILDLSVKFTSQICHENIKKKTLDGAYLADFCIDISCALLIGKLFLPASLERSIFSLGVATPLLGGQFALWYVS